MEQQQLATLLSIETCFPLNKSPKSHSKRRLIANGLHKLNDDEKLSDDVFALTMNIFDRFIGKSSSLITDRYCQLIALSSFTLAKKLRTNIAINNENELTSLIFSNENYTDEEIFDTEQLIAETLDWDLSTVVPHDYIHLILPKILPMESDLAKIRLHVQNLLAVAICEINTFTVLPSVLCCACIKAAIKGLRAYNTHPTDELIMKTILCNQLDLHHTHRMIEQFFQTCLQAITPPPRRRCLAPIDTINKKTNSSPRVK